MTSRKRDARPLTIVLASAWLLIALAAASWAQPVSDTTRIRVELVRYAASAASVQFGSDGMLDIRSSDGKEISWQGESDTIQVVALDNGRLTLTNPGSATSSSDTKTVHGPVTIAGGGPVRIASQETQDSPPGTWHTYRGEFSVSALDSGKLRVIDNVALEDYVASVVSCEIGAGAPAEALKAQCVASRTYALYNLNKLSSEGADVDDSTRTQQYGDLNTVNPAVLAAVSSTRGEVLTYDGKLIDAVYSTDCGGITAAGPPDEPYLKSVLDPECESEAPWTKSFTTPELVAALSRDPQITVHQLFSIAVKETDESERVVSVLITCQDQSSGTLLSQAISGSTLRRLLGNDVVKSTRFTIAPTATGFLFTGRGWGHGMGMCQAGAIALANGPASASYRDILAHYYSGCSLTTIQSIQPAT